MNIFTSTIPYYLILLSYLLASMLTGWSLFKITKITIAKEFRAITHSLIGISVLISLYGLFITKGITILSSLVLLLAYSLWSIRSQQQKEPILNEQKNWAIDWRGFGILALLGLGWFAMYSAIYYTYAESGDLFGPTHPDIHFYMKIGTIISATGNENTLGWSNYFDKSLVGVSPYHYFDLYFNQLLCDITKLPASKLYILVSSPLIITLGGGLLVSLARKWSSNLTFLLFFSAALISFTGIKLYLPIHESGMYSVSYLVNAELKYVTPFIFLLSSLIMMSFGFEKKGLLPILALPIISFTYVPGVLFGISSYLFFQYWLEPKKRRELLTYIGLLFSVYIYIFIFYKLFSIPQDYSFLAALPLKDSLITALYNPIPVLRIIVGSMVKIWIDYIPQLSIILLSLYFVPRSAITWKKWLSPAILYSSIVVGGFIGWALLINYTDEAQQQFWILQGAVLTATAAVSIIYLVPQLKKQLIQKIILASCLVLFLFKISTPFIITPWLFKKGVPNTMSLSFTKQVLEHIDNNKNEEFFTKIVFFCDKTRPSIYYPASGLFSLNNHLIFETVTPDIVEMVNGNLQKNRSDALQESDYVTLPFYRFCKQNKDKHQTFNSLEIQRSFIKENNINYLVTDKIDCEDRTTLLNDYQLIAKDEISQISFYQRK